MSWFIIFVLVIVLLYYIDSRNYYRNMYELQQAVNKNKKEPEEEVKVEKTVPAKKYEEKLPASF